MKATALAASGTQAINAGWILDLTNKWKLANDYVADFDGPGAVKAERVLKLLICHDLPILVRELIRLRPELA